MEIGYPTDVKHVAYIGQDSPSVTGPSWMNEFRTSSNFATPSFGNPTNPIPQTTCFNPDMEDPMRSKPRTVNSSSSDHHSNASSKKNKSRKTKSTSSPRFSPPSSSSARRSSRAPKSKLTLFSEATPTKQI
ncbi:hypothetical protein QN277_005352 [Acacia crassicarpa]|uniref:CRIB domain-containing protein n=1 Tax=Acacia crassicarpa TaxID=499986 RepID=A0AAE1JTD5_9FABA|nr:hypothetical protein QN277_005352 [Acacia crassicarpa]